MKGRFRSCFEEVMGEGEGFVDEVGFSRRVSQALRRREVNHGRGRKKRICGEDGRCERGYNSCEMLL